LEFLSLTSAARLVLTDSGGLQEETTALGIPCLTLRENTERPVTVAEGTNEVVGTDPARVLAAARRALGGGYRRGRIPALWDGEAGERAAEAVVAFVAERRGAGRVRQQDPGPLHLAEPTEPVNEPAP
jgi:UDP-N-acetylglucosamine 2-epimerase (non-hydrolysing)